MDALKDWVTKPLSVKWGDTELGSVPGWVVVAVYYAVQGGWDKVAVLVKTYLM